MSQSMQHDKHLESTQIFAKLMYFVASNHMDKTLRKKKRRKAPGREGFQMFHLGKMIKVNATENNHN